MLISANDPLTKTIVIIALVVVCTESVIVLAVVVVLLFGLFDGRVDNAEIFKLVGPAFVGVMSTFSTILGGLVVYWMKSRDGDKG